MMDTAMHVYADLTSMLSTLRLAQLSVIVRIVFDFPSPPSPAMIMRSWGGLRANNIFCKCQSTMSDDGSGVYVFHP